mmetsp:Transcript_26131/g.62161  ORF Transcript_26131/g.62161 Transcript_26131/m.62161 type:complete len:210 (+) Transcript_26131:437-1066(+)
MYLNRFRWSSRTLGSCFIFMHFSASWRQQQLSQKNLSSCPRVSVELKLRKQLVREEFCSMSRLRSRKSSSREVTVSHIMQRVSLTSFPWKISCTQVRARPSTALPFACLCPRASFSRISARLLSRKLRNSCASWCMKPRNSSLSFFRRWMKRLGAMTPVFFRWLLICEKSSERHTSKCSSPSFVIVELYCMTFSRKGRQKYKACNTLLQ